MNKDYEKLKKRLDRGDRIPCRDKAGAFVASRRGENYIMGGTHLSVYSPTMPFESYCKLVELEFRDEGD